MANQRLTDKTAYAGVLALADLVHIVDVSDTSQNAAGSSYKLPLSTIKTLFTQAITLNTIPKGTGTTIADGSWAFATTTIYPLTDGANIGLPSTNRVGTIYMSSFIDFAANLTFSENGTDRGGWLTGGNFGIGTTSPTAKLNVVGTGATSATYSLKIVDSSLSPLFYVRDDGRVSINNTISGTAMLTVQELSASNNVVVKINNSAGTQIAGIYTNGTADGYLVLSDSAASGNVSISANGTSFLGGGNTIIGGISSALTNQKTLMVMANGDDQGIVIARQNVSTTPQVRLFAHGTLGGSLQLSTTGGTPTTQLYANDTDNWLVSGAAQKLGIGTTTPTAKLHVVGTGATSATYSLKIQNSSNSPLLNILDSGEVGIGDNAAAGDQLYVKGGAISLHTTAAAAFASYAMIMYNLPSSSYIFQARTNGHIGFKGVADATWETMFNVDGGNGVQIRNNTSGGTNTAALLIDSGAAQGYINVFDSTSTAFTGLPSGQGALIFRAGDRTTPNSSFNNIAFAPNGANTFILFGSTTGGAFVEGMRFDNAIGRLAIGTTTPTAKLDINGATGYNQLRMRTTFTPANSADANGNVGDLAWDDSFIYIRNSTQWERVATAAF